jgi:hypothetical protein
MPSTTTSKRGQVLVVNVPFSDRSGVKPRPALRAAGYDGWVSFEYEAEEPEATGIPRALAYLKRMSAG